ncbi:slit homolog 1 protein-like [Sycon ciliatum]|uniref:slit homolog 1 protein-like n=1 Tax=Sycon ciliatum TaxID=27933 RepID=UPI0031F614E4
MASSGVMWVCLMVMVTVEFNNATTTCSLYCTCSGESMSCSNLPNFSSIPDPLPRSVKYLNVQTSNLGSLIDQMFPTVESIYLRWCNVTSISRDAFKNTPDLRFLVISANPLLTSLPSDLLANVPKLTHLVLGDNWLLTIPPDLLRSVPLLTLLRLEHSPRITIPPRFLDNVPLLEYLSLTQTNLSVLPPDMIVPSKRLTRLEMELANLAEFPFNMFVANQNLTKLYIRVNPLKLTLLSSCPLGVAMRHVTELLADPDALQFARNLLAMCGGLSAFQCYNNKGKTDYFCQCPLDLVYDGNDCVNTTVCDPDNRAGACNQYPICQLNEQLSAYECTCRTGLKLGSHLCELADECAERTHACDTFALCNNTIANYTCKCKVGFTGNGWMCSDIDDCGTMNKICGNNSRCINSLGSYFCACHPGFMTSKYPSAIGEEHCVNVQECHSQPCGNGRTCVDTIGSFVCISTGTTQPSNAGNNSVVSFSTGSHTPLTVPAASISSLAAYAGIGVLLVIAGILTILLVKSRRERSHRIPTISLNATNALRLFASHERMDQCHSNPRHDDQSAGPHLEMTPNQTASGSILDASCGFAGDIGNLMDNEAYGVNVNLSRPSEGQSGSERADDCVYETL